MLKEALLKEWAVTKAAIFHMREVPQKPTPWVTTVALVSILCLVWQASKKTVPCTVAGFQTI